jgi:hypothetical protein
MANIRGVSQLGVVYHGLFRTKMHSERTDCYTLTVLRFRWQIRYPPHSRPDLDAPQRLSTRSDFQTHPSI